MNVTHENLSPEEWAARDNASYRSACQRQDNPWCMEIPPVMPEPVMENQILDWRENTCGLWSPYRRYLSINGKWVELNPRYKYSHPLAGVILE